MRKSKPGNKMKSFSDNTTIDIFIKTQIFAMIISFASFLLFSVIGLMADLSVKYDLLCSLLSFGLASFAVGFFIGRKLRQNGLLAGIIYSLPLNTLIVLLSLIFSDFTVDLNIAITATVLLVTAGAGGIVAVNSRLKR